MNYKVLIVALLFQLAAAADDLEEIYNKLFVSDVDNSLQPQEILQMLEKLAASTDSFESKRPEVTKELILNLVEESNMDNIKCDHGYPVEIDYSTSSNKLSLVNIKNYLAHYRTNKFLFCFSKQLKYETSMMNKDYLTSLEILYSVFKKLHTRRGGFPSIPKEKKDLAKIIGEFMIAQSKQFLPEMMEFGKEYYSKRYDNTFGKICFFETSLYGIFETLENIDPDLKFQLGQDTTSWYYKTNICHEISNNFLINDVLEYLTEQYISKDDNEHKTKW